MRRLASHWLLGLNAAIGVFIAGAFVAPILAMTAVRPAADALYAVYHLTCHQWAFRSFFLFGPQAVYGQQQLQNIGVDPFTVIGQYGLGWKMAFCERDLAIYLGALLVGVLYGQRRTLQPASVLVYVLLILPMAIDGFSQLFGWRESTWELRVVTGLLFGAASAWLLYPRFDASFGFDSKRRRYAPDSVCAPRLPTPRG